MQLRTAEQFAHSFKIISSKLVFTQLFSIPAFKRSLIVYPRLFQNQYSRHSKILQNRTQTIFARSSMSYSSSILRDAKYESKIPIQGIHCSPKVTVSVKCDVNDLAKDANLIVIALESSLFDDELSDKISEKLQSEEFQSFRTQLDTLLLSLKKSRKDGDLISIMTKNSASVAQELAFLTFSEESVNEQYSIFDIIQCTPETVPQATLQRATAEKASKALADLIGKRSIENVLVSFRLNELPPHAFQWFLESLLLNLNSDSRFKSNRKQKNVKNGHPTQLNFHIRTSNANNASATESLKNTYEMIAEETKQIVEGIHYTKELGNTPANICTTESLALEAMGLGRLNNFFCEILGEKECLQHGMNAYLAVHAGSKFAPQFIHLTYKASNPIKKLAIIGKGICMDTGGYNLKVGCGIESMKFDMCAAAAVLGAAKIIGNSAPENLQIHFVIPAAENMVDKNAIRPGDIVTASDGTTIEIGNTDAEGRLTLADALLYTENVIKPDYILGLATLTGACMVGLGCDIAGLYGTHPDWTNLVLQSAKEAGTPLWPLPLYKPYRSLLDSQIADMNNTASQRYGGSITAALFLQSFVKKTPWCHIDMAGPAYNSSSNLATGYGTKLLIKIIERLSQKNIRDTT